ncbi:F-box domain containing protein [Pandoravirus salinus]|uniref:F-box domain containing protein n=1 Tax=Pandoravirus salinus TaxID=1349410 RepID=S4VYM2_9VIRU|nr:F-box domain [Pandoravirus salinus]AGO84561.2 F-box domain containing protein [Pandoravirus salinus]
MGEHAVYVDPELWAMILADPVVGLDPAYRCMARRVCRRWRDLIDRAAPTDRGWREPAVDWLARRPIYRVETMVPWSRGRIMAASVFAECYRLHPSDAMAHGTDCTSSIAVNDYERAFAAVGGDATPVGRCALMMLSLDPVIVDEGIRIAKEGAGSSRIALCAIKSAFRSGRTWVLDRVWEARPKDSASLSFACLTLRDVDVGMFDRLLHHAPNVPIFDTRDLRLEVARHIAGVFCGRVDRPWSSQWTHIAEDPDERECSLDSLVENDSVTLLRALDDVGLYDLPDDSAIYTVCSSRATKTAAWLIERARHKPKDALAGVLDKMVRGALKRSHDSDGFPSSDHPEALLSWLLGGPTPYDPLAPDAPISLDLLFRLASASDSSCEVPRCLLWLCLRWPREASQHLDAIRGAARQMLTRTGKWIDSYLCRDGTTLEYLVYTLDALHARLTNVGHAQSADDLLRAIDLCKITTECTGDLQTRATFLDHGLARCADDDSVPTRLALIRACVLRTIDPVAVDPWRATFASPAAWRRWFRVPDSTCAY